MFCAGRARTRRRSQLPPRLHGVGRAVQRVPQRTERHRSGQAGTPSLGTSTAERGPVPVADVEQLGINVIRGLAMDAPQERELGASRVPRWRSLPGPRALTPGHEVRPDRPEWPDRDRFVCQPATRRSCSTRCSTSRATGSTLDDLEAVPAVGSTTPGHPESATPRASRSPPGRSARASPTASAWASPSGTCGPVRRRHRRPPHVRDLQRRLTSGGHQPRGCLARRPPRARPPGLRLRRQPHHDRRPDRARLQRRCRRALRGVRMACRAGRRGANDLDGLEAALRRAMAEEDRPSLIILRSHIGYPSPEQDRHRGRPRQPARGRGDPLTKAGSGFRRTRSSTARPTCSTGTARPAPAAGRAWRGTSASPHGRATAPTLDACTRGPRSEGWAAKLPTFNVGEKVATRRAFSRVPDAPSTSCRGSSRAAPTSRRTPAPS